MGAAALWGASALAVLPAPRPRTAVRAQPDRVTARLASGAGAPDIAAANAVTCVRTSVSFAFVASSSVAVVFGLPVVPVAPAGSVAALVVAGPSSSVRILSIAATSVGQLLLRLAAVCDPVVLALADFIERAEVTFEVGDFALGLRREGCALHILERGLSEPDVLLRGALLRRRSRGCLL